MPSRYLNFHFYQPIRYKKGVVNNLVDRAKKLADRTFHEENLMKIREVLTASSHPKTFLDTTMKNGLKILYIRKDVTTKQSQDTHPPRLENEPLFKNQTEM